MDNIIFESERHFNFYDYEISHCQLLIRSAKGEIEKDNIDIIFFGTDYIQLLTYFKGITIKRVIEPLKHVHYKSVEKHLSYEGNHLFEIQTGGETFYIQGAFVHIFKNDLDFRETSLGVLEYIGRENCIATSTNHPLDKIG